MDTSHFRQDLRKNFSKQYEHRYDNVPFIVAGLLLGAVASGYASIFKICAEFSFHLFENRPLLWSILVPIGFGLSFFLVKIFSPESSGSGIPQVMAAIQYEGEKDSEWLNRLLGYKVIVIKTFSSLICVLAGGAIGREGPTIQIGSSLFVWISKLFPATKEQEARRMRNMILAGGASGIAAAFNTPLGGIVFAIEELAQESFRQFRTSVLLAVILSGMMAQWILGEYLYLGHPTIASATPLAILLSVGMGILGGGLGGIFGKTLYWGVSQRRKANTTARHFYWIFGLSGAFIILAFLSHGFSLGPGTENISNLLSQNSGSEFSSVAIRFITNQLTFLTGGAGGIFAPSLAVGANLGAWIGSYFTAYGVAPNLLAGVAMTAFLTGVTHAPLTSVVLVLEMTNQPHLLFPLMLGGLLANAVSKFLGAHSFYEMVSERFLEQKSL
jgi:H+/Cl- antiporter ClcA